MDTQTKAACKRAIRDIWKRSTTYKELIASARRGRGDYQCFGCGQTGYNQADMYAEHIIALELHDYSTMEEYFIIMTATDNIQPWSKICCKTEKDIQDRALVRIKKKQIQPK